MTEANFHLHPMMVHFPIALLISALGFEVMSFILKKEALHQTAVQIFILAAITAPLVVWTGLEEAEELHLVKHRVLDLHRTFALATMGIGLMSLPTLWVIRKKFAALFRPVFLALLVVIAVTVSIAAYNGGRLVYDYGVGTEEE